MTDEARARYGNLLSQAVDVSSLPQGPSAGEAMGIFAERFITAAGLVPLAAVRALFDDRDYVSTFWCQQQIDALGARFGEQGQ